MYECPNCNANLKFDIPTQMLLCDHCGEMMDPYAFQKNRDAEEHTSTETVYTVEEQEYEITVFTCPQCGGEIYGDDTTAATFCNYCGGATILDSRISKERRPKYIIPFKKTREDCRKIYAERMRSAPFAPRAMQKEESISRFRSIYMPYWIYTAEKDEKVTFGASEKRRAGDYIITTFYRLHTAILAKYKGLTYDAASSFSDTLSNAIAPYDEKEMKPFAPTFLSGFYADAEDVPAELYHDDVKGMVAEQLCQQVERDPVCASYTLGEDMYEEMKPNKLKSDLAMLPVWFLAYRYKDRVSYTVINGQTGKAAGDLPVDKGRFLTISLLLAIPIFAILNLLVVMRAGSMLFCAGLLSVVGAFLSMAQRKRLKAREDYMDDKGSGRYLVIGRKRDPGREHVRIMNSMQSVVMVGVMVASAAVYGVLAGTDSEWLGELVSQAVLLVGCMAASVVNVRKIGIFASLIPVTQEKVYLERKEILETIAKPSLGVLLALIVLIIHPAAELYYYIAALAILILMGSNALDLIDQYNKLATRPLPQFARRGGEADGK